MGRYRRVFDEDIALTHHLERVLPWIVTATWYLGCVITRIGDRKFSVYPINVGFVPEEAFVAYDVKEARDWIDRYGPDPKERALSWIKNGIWYRGFVITKEHPERLRVHGEVAVYAPHRCFEDHDVLLYTTTEECARAWIDRVCGDVRENEKAGT